jgi:ribonuclease BN (tRNA processing enzyme)
MKLTFLGTGGGRFMTINQLRGSGGFILEMDGENIHVDPGPGALVNAKKYGVKLLGKLTGVVISHTHPDHCTDAEMVIEAMTFGAKKKRGFVLGNHYVFNDADGDGYVRLLSGYHLRTVEKVKLMEPGDVFDTGKIKITATPTKHADSRAVGYVFSGTEKVGYTSDGEYFNGMEEHFRDCDYLIVNCMRPRDDPWPEQMNAAMAGDLVGKAKPKTAILTHMGMKMLRGVVDREAKWIEQRTGIKTVVARDGMVIDSEKKAKGLERFV